MLVSEIVTRVTRQFGDTANVQITSDDIIRWINDAQHELAVNNQLFQAIATTAVVAGTQTYTLPTGILTLRSIRYQNSKLQALNTNEAEELIVGAAANSTTGTPKQFWIWANQINLFPIPDTSGSTDLTIFYCRQPAAVAAVGDTPELPLQYHNAIVQYCLQQAYELDENMPMAQAKGSQFSESTKMLKDNVDWVERDFYPMITSTDIAEYSGGWSAWG